jgi:hypothetical protein
MSNFVTARTEGEDDDGGQSERLQLFVDTQTVRYLKALAQTGTYGRKHTKVAKALIEEGIRRAIRDKLIVVEKDTER